MVVARLAFEKTLILRGFSARIQPDCVTIWFPGLPAKIREIRAPPPIFLLGPIFLASRGDSILINADYSAIWRKFPFSPPSPQHF